MNKQKQKKAPVKKGAAKKPKQKQKKASLTIRPVGRPSKYDPSLIKKVYDYLELCIDDYKIKTFEYKNSKGKIEHEVKVVREVRLPSVEDFSTFVGIHRDSLYVYAKEHPEFSDTLDLISVEQKKKLLNGGISGNYAPGMAKFILSANHDMREKKDITSNNQSILGIDYVVPKEMDDQENHENQDRANA